jgi:hypothetical protein
MLFVSLLFTGFTFSQTSPKFKMTKDGVKPVVITFDTSYTASLIYTRVKEWISLNNKSPKSVTKVDTENSLIKFSCYKEKAWHIKNAGVDLWNDLAYTLTVEMKTGKCRITFATDETRYKVWYNTDGTLKKNFKESESTFENTINETLTSLYNHIKGEKKKAKDEW